MPDRPILSALLLCLACSEPRISASGTTITNVRIVDGTGAAAYTGAVRFVADTIVDAGASVAPAAGDSVLDGRGLILAPGFIDTHSHHDDGLTETPEALAAVSQGITTIIAGQDGSHPLPLAKTLDSLGSARPAVNVAFYVGHGTLRSAVMGDDFKRKATPAEVDSMAALLRTELAAGGLGLSTGLEYDPGIYSDRSEVMALAKVTAALGGRYISHIRSEDRTFWQAVDEIIAIGREAQLPVQISHMKLGMIPLWGHADSLIHVLDRARASGVSITADVYPYPYWQSTLTVLYPNRDFENLAETERILRDIAKPEGLLLGAYAPNPAYAGKTVAEIAALRHERPSKTLMTLIRDATAMRRDQKAAAENGVVSGEVESVIATGMDEADIAKLLAWPHSNVCSDGMLNGPHPRGFGAFSRVLSKYVRAEHALTLEDAIRKMTSAAAQHAGLMRRGTIARGSYADLVLFDPATVQDRSTPKEPHLTSSGIAAVWVNGRPVWRDGRVTGERPGHILKRQAKAVQRRPTTWSRDSLIARLADLRKIHTPEGIEVLEQIDVGGTKQWISIRGLNIANPVLLMLHGGPGSPVMAMSWAFQKPWEDFFTVVQWDQRGMGKNFLATDTSAVGPTMTVDRLTQDAEEVVAYLRRRLNKDKIVVLGFSFGTTLGTRLAAARPEWLHAYVAVGQSAPNGERYLYERVLAVATARNDTAALRELRAIAPYPPPNGFDLDKGLLARKYARLYDGGWYGKPDFKLYFSLPEWGQEYTQADVEAYLPALRWAEEQVFMRGRQRTQRPPEGRPTGREGAFSVPVILMMGRYDLHTPYEAARVWFDRISAPNKKFITFERSSHYPMFEEPGRFLAALLSDVLPLTGEATTFTRLP